ncbi:hypothetical protein [Arthrobacter sp. MYb227]|uniref:hypothetical protein n=1 Tax=Arthrobacter sp. MYb227 TaxID=1848601 RepID=UPI0011B003C2|nr:hypothetical protein [Arthrobacter sp. MYb227]
MKFIVMNFGSSSIDGTLNSNVVGAESAVQGPSVSTENPNVIVAKSADSAWGGQLELPSRTIASRPSTTLA